VHIDSSGDSPGLAGPCFPDSPCLAWAGAVLAPRSIYKPGKSQTVAGLASFSQGRPNPASDVTQACLEKSSFQNGPAPRAKP
jgi:hypothetical protein